ncbi:Omp28-related outer membrane protein [bacterium]|nr:Omp28-related outer membrane protein [bacterium]
MKKFYLLLAGAAFGLQAMAQTFVSTEVQNKNAVLEEYTGIHCTWCPDGHKRAQAIHDAYPGRVVLINIHEGPYSTPSSTDPDFRTDYGEAIANQAVANSWPSGSVNRHMFAGRSLSTGTAMSRVSNTGVEYWKLSAEETMSMTSPVNVAIQTSIDLAKRELTIVAEVYYTGDATKSTNKLNIAILQNNVQGPQTGASSLYPANILPNGKYNHQHMLRDLVTGQWGEDITETTTGSFFTKTYKYSIPENYKGVPVALQFLQVAAFVAEGTQEIITGVAQDVELPSSVLTDLSITNKTSAPTGGICAETVTPKVTVKNEGPNDINSFTISAFMNGTEYPKTYNTKLAVGQSTDIDWGEMSLPGGYYTVTIDEPKNIDGGDILDPNILNSSGANYSGYSFLSKALVAPYIAGFNGNIPPNLALDQSQNTGFTIVSSTQTPLGAKNTTGAVRFALHSSWNVAGRPGSVLFGKTDLSATTNPSVSYWYAYSDGSQGGTAPTIAIEVSTDCGSSWNTIHTENCRQTGQPSDPNNFYVPSSSQYRRIYADLTDYASEEVIVRVTVVPGSSGNSLYLDEINLISDAASVSEINTNNTFNVYPNPFQNETHLAIELEQNTELSVNVYDGLGRIVKSIISKEYGAGSHNLTINTADLENGIYILKVESNGAPMTQKVIIKE